MELEVATSSALDTAMVSPSNSSNNTTTTTSSSHHHHHQHTHSAESLRLSEIESAHLCPSARVKMEELFKQWLNVDGTKDMIHAIVDDIRSGKDMDAIVAQYASASTHLQQPQSGHSSSSSGIDTASSSPSRSPKRPPNYHHFSANGVTSSPNSRKKHLVVSLFGDELHGEQPMSLDRAKESSDVVMKDTDAAAAAAGDQSMESAPADEHAALRQLRKQIPKLYTPGEGRRGRLRGLSTDSIARKSVCLDDLCCLCVCVAVSDGLTSGLFGTLGGH